MTVIVSKVKQIGEVAFTIDGHEQNKGDVKLYLSIWNHYVSDNCSIDTAQYNIGAGWVNMTLSANQVESVSSIPITSRKRKYVYYWDAAADLDATQEYTNVQVRFEFNDEPSAAGETSAAVSYTIDSIDFRPTTDIIPYKPFPNDEDFIVKFKNLLSYSSVSLHFKIEVDTVNTFDSVDYSSADTSVSTTGWTFDGGAFPGGGASPVTDLANAEEITYDGFGGLSEDTWFIRITRSLN